LLGTPAREPSGRAQLTRAADRRHCPLKSGYFESSQAEAPGDRDAKTPTSDHKSNFGKASFVLLSSRLMGSFKCCHVERASFWADAAPVIICPVLAGSPGCVAPQQREKTERL
jgi:hypothetical protein